MIQETTISIIVPCYNAEKFLRETLDCLQKQTIKNWNCIIVNDGSTDGSLSIIKEYAQKDPRFIYIDKKNEGPAIARNTAIAASHGKYILPLDADDLIDPSYTEKAVEYFENNPETKLVYCEAESFGDKNKKWDLKPYSYDELLWGNMIFCSAVYRREDFNKTIGYNPNMRGGNEDWDFWLTFLKKEDKVYRIPEVLFFYRRHRNTRTATANQQMVNLNKIMIKNHYELYEPFIDMLLNYRWMADELERVYNSKTYKIGNLFMYPFRWIKMQLEKRRR